MQQNPSPRPTNAPATPAVAGTPCSPGTIAMWGGTLANIPAGWLHCDGTLVNHTQYQALWNAIGTNFGANPPGGSFYLPDLRGRFIRGVDDQSQRDPDVTSRKDMQNSSILSHTVGSVQSHAFQNHVHPYNIFPSGSGNIASGSYWAGGMANTGLVDSSSYQVSSETRPINVYLFFIIKF